MLDTRKCMHFSVFMKQITVRNLSEAAIESARKRARREGKSLNRVYVETIEAGLGIGKGKRQDDLDQFAGDSDFGPDWEKFLDKELNRIDKGDWS
jgi:hypothetical protein